MERSLAGLQFDHRAVPTTERVRVRWRQSLLWYYSIDVAWANQFDLTNMALEKAFMEWQQKYLN